MVVVLVLVMVLVPVGILALVRRHLLLEVIQQSTSVVPSPPAPLAQNGSPATQGLPVCMCGTPCPHPRAAHGAGAVRGWGLVRMCVRGRRGLAPGRAQGLGGVGRVLVGVVHRGLARVRAVGRNRGHLAQAEGHRGRRKGTMQKKAR